jgi:hypothetical protein
MSTDQEILECDREWAAKMLEQIDTFNRLHAETHEKLLELAMINHK